MGLSCLHNRESPHFGELQELQAGPVPRPGSWSEPDKLLELELELLSTVWEIPQVSTSGTARRRRLPGTWAVNGGTTVHGGWGTRSLNSSLAGVWGLCLLCITVHGGCLCLCVCLLYLRASVNCPVFPAVSAPAGGPGLSLTWMLLVAEVHALQSSYQRSID